MRLFLVTLLLIHGLLSQHAMMPNPALTPGATDPAVTQETIHQTICKPGYTATVRSVPESVNRAVMKRYNLPESDLHLVEIDHLYSLELAGSNSIDNLWPEYYDPAPGQVGYLGARDKDVVETWLHRKICNGDMTLTAAQQAIRTWPKWYQKIKSR
jgi:hypothetical protein